jgi:hypothetical protein
MYVILCFCFVKPDTSLRDFTETVANKCAFSAFIDCCHSGAMLEGAKEIIGNSTVNPTINKPRTPKNRSYNFGEPSGRPPGVQISGCQNHQKACQVYFEDLEGWSTFFTQSFLSVIEETGGNMSNKNWLKEWLETWLECLMRKSFQKEIRGETILTSIVMKARRILNFSVLSLKKKSLGF